MFKSIQDDIKKFLSEQAGKVSSWQASNRESASRAVVPKPLQPVARAVQGVNDYLGARPPSISPQDGPLKTVRKIATNQVANTGRAAMEILNTPSYILGGALRGSREQMQGNFQAPKTGVKFRITPRGGPQKGQQQEIDVGSLAHPTIVGAFRGLKNKEALMTEAPSAVGIKPDSIPGLAVGLVAEVAAPGPGGEVKTAKALKEAPEVAKVLSKGDDIVRIIGTKADDVTKARKFLVSLINKSSGDEDAALKIRNVVIEAMEKGDPKTAENIQTAIGSQLQRFKNQADNPNAQRFLSELKTGYEKLGEVSTRKVTAKSIFDTVKQTTYQTAKNDFDDFIALQRTRTPSTRNYVSQIGDAIKQNTTSPLTANIDELTDLSNLRAGNSDVVRNFEKVFGKKAPEAKRLILDPFDASKGRMVDDYNTWKNELEEVVVKKLGIKDRTKESAAIQMFGEKKLTLEQLQQQFPKSWENIVEAERWFRAKYDGILEEVNAARRLIYGDNPEKLIPARADYFRHFREMEDGFQGLRNIFDTPSNIASSLAGTSDFTKPKSKWLSFAQKREGDRSTMDAVGGFLDYIRPAAYAKNVDPQIESFRGLADELARLTAEGPNKGKLNVFIEFLGDFANDLSGKTNPGDRAIQKWIPGGRTTMKAVEWASNRFKKNAVLGNISSSLMQSASVPMGIADVGPVNATLGAIDTMTSIFRELPQQAKSTFLKERWFNPEKTFNPGVIENAEKFAANAMGVIDGVATRYIWNSEYRKALASGIDNMDEAARAADYATRKIVAGRGIGEVPLNQKARTIQLIAPFQLEVANQWLVMKDWVDEKTFSKFVTLFLANNAFNSMMEPVTGNRPLFDPLNAVADGIQAYDEETDQGDATKKFAGRLAGEVLSNLPYTQMLLGGLPQYGDIPVVGLSKDELFGEQDPTRFGSGVPLMKAFSSPENFVTSMVTPFGGAQLKKFGKGLSALVNEGVFNDAGQLQFPVGDGLATKLQSVVFGPYATQAGQFYFDNDLRNFSDKETQAWKLRVERGDDPVNAWMSIQRRKVVAGMPEKIREVMNDKDLSREEKRTKVANIRLQSDALLSRIDSFTGEAGEGLTQFDAEQEQSLADLKKKSTAKFVVGGKKGRKPAAPSLPKFSLKQSVKRGGGAPDTFTYDFDKIETDIEELKALGQLPPIDMTYR